MHSTNTGTKTRIGVGAEVGINVGIETGVRVETEEKTDRAGKGPQQKMESPSCMINLTSGSLALGQPQVIQASLRNKPLILRGATLPTAPRRMRKLDRSTIHQERKRNNEPA